jgi:phosphoribosyl 1,2-cyclic phosphate phosphodiesterase
VEVMPIKAMHKDLPVLGYRIGKLGYITDANHIEPSEIEKLKGVEVLVINALRKTKHFSHFCLPEALEIINSVAPKQAYLTHLSHEMGLYAEVSKELPPNVHLAYDGLRVDI